MSASDVARLISSAAVSNSEIRRAAVHLPKPLREALFSEESPKHRSASGMFFEGLIYEILLAESETSPVIKQVAAKLNDAEYVPFDRFAKDGLWYSRNGELQFRIHGRAAAEVDFLVLCADDTLVFGEATLRPETSSELETEVAYKKELLKTFLDKENLPYAVQFVLAAPKKTDVTWLSEEDAYCFVDAGDELWKRIHVNEVLHKKRSPAPSKKRVDGKVLFHNR